LKLNAFEHAEEDQMHYPPDHFLGLQRNGVNNVLMESAINGLTPGTDYPLYSNALLDWYTTSKGMRSIRVTFRWEAVQPDSLGPIPGTADSLTYWTNLVGLVTRLIDRGAYVVLAPWQFNINSSDTDVVYNSSSFTAAAFSDFWGKFASAMNAAVSSVGKPVGNVVYELINEPHERSGKPSDIGITIDDWFSYARAALTAIRLPGTNNNTVLIPGMNYAAAHMFTTNGSAAKYEALFGAEKNVAVTVHCYFGTVDPKSEVSTVLRQAFESADVSAPAGTPSLIQWARQKNVKVHVGEIAVDAGDPGSSLVAGQAKWQQWHDFCVENDDVIIGWNWWANTQPPFGWHGDSTQGNHWPLTKTGGTTQTVYMDVIESSVRTANLRMRDNIQDSGSEPNTSTGAGYESPDIWVRRSNDGGTVGESVFGGQPAFVSLKITNSGDGDYIGHKDVVQLYWAKASGGLGYPSPWIGSLYGGLIGRASIGPIAAGGSTTITIDWPNTPQPNDYRPVDDHFCLLACITKTRSSEIFADFEGPSLNDNVLRLRKVGWRNIHILSLQPRQSSHFVIENLGTLSVKTTAVLEAYNASGKKVPFYKTGIVLSDWEDVRILPTSEAPERPEKFNAEEARLPKVLTSLNPGDRFACRIIFPEGNRRSLVIRGYQYVEEEGRNVLLGGQTFVFGKTKPLQKWKIPVV
jgi:Cellulase (glycosyl hydrolase family 5)